MSDVEVQDAGVELETAPPAAGSNVFPVWTDLQDTWRATDAHWLRNRTIQIFPDAASRTTALAGQTSFGMLSILQAGSVAGGPDFWNGSAWESTRYPNLNVTSDGTSVTLKREGASPSTGLQLLNDGSVNIAKEFVGTGGVGSTQDTTGFTIKIGGKTVKLATDATSLTVDSPVAITGTLSATGAITAPSLTVPTITSTGTINAVAIAATGAISSSGAVSGATVTGGDVILGSAAPYGTLKHRTGSGTAEIDIGSDSTVRILGTALTVNPATTFAGAITVNGAATFKVPPVVSQAGKDASIQEAMIIMASGNVTPTSNPPDGTLFVTY